MGLNIKNEETCLLARDLARLTGETMTAAITVALRERLARTRRRHDVHARIERNVVQPSIIVPALKDQWRSGT